MRRWRRATLGKGGAPGPGAPLRPFHHWMSQCRRLPVTSSRLRPCNLLYHHQRPRSLGHHKGENFNSEQSVPTLPSKPRDLNPESDVIQPVKDPDATRLEEGGACPFKLQVNIVSDVSAKATAVAAMTPLAADDVLQDTAGEGGDVVLVTGGCGFLGQHVVRELQQRAPHVREIRVLDLLRFASRLDYKLTKPVTSIVGSVTDSDAVQRATRDAISVIHIAGAVSYGTFPDFGTMEEVNVDGTRSVVRSCLQNSVRRLLYCSTVDVVVGFEPIRGGEESDTPVPTKFLFPGYPETKLQGERLVLAVNGQLCSDGEALSTIALRPNVMYGELDPYYVTSALRQAASSAWPRRNTLLRVGYGLSLFQQCYVGNTAAAFVQADLALRHNPGNLGGQAFFVPDDTPLQNSFTFIEPFLQSKGYHLSRYPLPYKLVYGILYAAEMVLQALSPLVKIHLANASCSVRYINMDLYFKNEKARTMFGFQPVYDPEVAWQKSYEYYKTLKL